jgi:DNA-binding beta-propeller fold protein YncE
MNESTSSSRVWVCGLAVVVRLAGWPVHAVPPIVQLPGTAACVTEDGTGGACVDGVALDLAARVAVSPDGRNVYATARLSDAIVVFDRNIATGALTQKAGTDGCISQTGTGALCQIGVALDDTHGLAISPDGRNVYATAGASDSVLIYDRDLATGELSFKVDILGCVSEDGSGDQCIDGFALNNAAAVAVSPDGRNVYVASFSSDAVAVFDRDANGELTQKAGMAGCVSEGGAGGCAPGVALNAPSALAVSPDGKNVYATTQLADSVVIFDRDIDTGALTQKNGTNGCISEDSTGGDCVNGVALDVPFSVVVTADGRSVYVASQDSDAVAVFDRNLTTGVLTQKAGLLGCISLDGTGGACTTGVALDKASGVAASPDGKGVYVVAQEVSQAVVAFDRDVSTGALTQKSGVAACVSHTGSLGDCVDGVALLAPLGVAVSADGRHVYVATAVSDGVAAFTRDVPPYDIDGDGASEPLTDGLLLLRHRFGFTGSTLITGAVDSVNCIRCTAAEIEAYITALLGP